MKKRLLAIIPVLLVVFLCSANVFAASTRYVAPTLSASYNYGNVNISAIVTALGEWYDSSAYGGQYGKYIYYIKLQLTNMTNQYQIADTNGFRVNIASGYSNYMTYHDYHSFVITDVTDNIGYYGISTSDSGFNVVMRSQDLLVLNPNETRVMTMIVEDVVTPGAGGTYSWISGTFGTSSMLNHSNASVSFGLKPDSFSGHDVAYFVNNNSFPNNVIAYLDGIAYRLTEFFNSYNSNTTDSNAVISNSGSLETQSDTIHNQENGYYTQTNTALANTGLSNYQFSSDVVGGMGIVKDQFTYVWNKLGNYNVVYVFSLTLSIALMIIRHVRPIRRKQEE